MPRVEVPSLVNYLVWLGEDTIPDELPGRVSSHLFREKYCSLPLLGSILRLDILERIDKLVPAVGGFN